MPWMFAAGMLLAHMVCLGQGLTAHLETASGPRAADGVRGLDFATSLLQRDFANFTVNRRLELKLPWNAQQHTFLFGPQLQVVNKGRFTVNAWLLGGTVKRSALVAPFLEPTEAAQPVMGSTSMPLNTIVNGANQAAASVGASADWRIYDRLTYRLIQPEWLFLGTGGSTTRDFRLSTGLHFELGKH